ncbi:SirB1 family protein [Paludisphaera mucosa]|uniref:Transglutaminase-like domain-containing protein n=1 Tax=Paludisphaera mucosa TaxID=3030827 RepID=A0ABT6F7Y9_9BACT|nr:transglutaminase-like domain-containing protein [Paludisphaera mucosa]MDG3003699.1 transglutaminase-like domain-containing protein [Paludisphaera mucosa]
MRSTDPSSPEFDRVVAGDPRPDLARVALEIARDFHPGLDVEACLGRIHALAERVRLRRREGASARKVLGQINWVLFIEEGYTGNTEDYFDPRNSFLDEVLDRKTGIPISLSILYGSIAERLGVSLGPVNSPAHFLLRLDDGESTFVDPFHGGELLDPDACQRRIAELTGKPGPLPEARLAACSPATVVARMLRNLKSIYVGQEDFASAHVVQRRLAAVATDPLEQRDLGMLCLQLDRAGEAIDPLVAYLRSRPTAADAETVEALLSGARAIVAQWN